MPFRIFIMTFLLLSVNARTLPARTEAAKSAGKGGKKAETGSENVLRGPVSASRYYVHRWIEFPAVQGRSLKNPQPLKIVPQEGRAMVVMFLASWCLPCQQMIHHFKKLEQTYAEHYTDFVYVFAHDTEADAAGFANAYKLGSNALLGSAALLESFHQPELPSVYVGDRYRWLVFRSLDTKPADLQKIDAFLKLHTAN